MKLDLFDLLKDEVFVIGIVIVFFVMLIVVGVAMGEEIRYGTASWYSVESCKREGTWQKYGGLMANEEKFKNEEKTCASWDYEFGTKLIVTNLQNNKSTIVVVSDRGPNKKLYKKGRIIDLSKRAFSEIADSKQGVIEVEIKEIK